MLSGAYLWGQGSEQRLIHGEARGGGAHDAGASQDGQILVLVHLLQAPLMLLVPACVTPKTAALFVRYLLPKN